MRDNSDLFLNRFSSFFWDNLEFCEHLVDDLEEGGFGHRTTLDALVDGDDVVELFDFFALIEAIEEKFDFVLEFCGKGVSLGARHPRAGAGADCDQFFGLRTDFFELFLLFLGIDGAFDEGDIEFVEDVFGLQNARVANVENFAPCFEMVIHDFGKNHRVVFAAGEREPADSEFFTGVSLRLLHSTNMVAYPCREFQIFRGAVCLFSFGPFERFFFPS